MRTQAMPLTLAQNLIYQALLHHDKIALSTTLKDVGDAYCRQVDLLSPGSIPFKIALNEILPAIVSLTKQGFIHAVEFALLQISDDYFTISVINIIALTVAKYCCIDLAEKLRLEKQADINSIAEGAVENSNWNYMEKLIDLGAREDLIIRKLGELGSFVMMENLLARYFEDCNALVGIAALGVAEGGHVRKTRELIQRGASINAAVWAAARGGHYHLADELIVKGADPRFAAQGAISNSYNHYVFELQIKFLANPSDRFQTSQAALDYIESQQSLENFDPEGLLSVRSDLCMFEKAHQLITLKRQYPGLTDDQGLSFIHHKNSGAYIYLLGLVMLTNPQILKIKLPCELILRVFDYLFHFTETPLYCEKRSGFGLFLFHQSEKIKNERKVALDSRQLGLR